MKVVRHDQLDNMGPSETSSVTSCPPQPHLESIRTAPVFIWLEPFLGGDPFTKVVKQDQWDTVSPSETPSRTSYPP